MASEFTKEEITLLKENTKQIIDFLVPLKKDIRKYHTIQFGRTQYGNCYSISFNPNKIYGMMGRVSIALESNDTTCDYTLEDNYSAPDFMAKLCYEWQAIKNQILTIVETEKAITNSIRNFKL